MDTKIQTRLNPDLLDSDSMQRCVMGVAQTLLELCLVKSDGEDWKRAVNIAQYAVDCFTFEDRLDPKSFESIKKNFGLRKNAIEFSSR